MLTSARLLFLFHEKDCKVVATIKTNIKGKVLMGNDQRIIAGAGFATNNFLRINGLGDSLHVLACQ